MMREYAADVEGLLDDLGIMRAATVGLSMGGLVTMELAKSRPERYWAIGLVTTTTEPVTPHERVTRRERADAVEPTRSSVTGWGSSWTTCTPAYGPACPPAIRARIDTMLSAAPPAGAAAALRGRAERPDYRPPRRARHPRLVCTGSEDP